MGKPKKINILFLTNIILLIIEITSIYLIYTLYTLVYRIEYLIPIILIQIIFTIKCFICKNNHIQKKHGIYFFISICILIITYLNLPMYTYNSGKNLIISNFSSQDDFEICYINLNQKTIPVSENNSNILISDKFYYYKINLNGYYIYYVVNPKNGEIKKLSNEFWQ